MKKQYNSPEFEFREINFLLNVLADSKLPPEGPAGDDVDPNPGDFGPDF